VQRVINASLPGGTCITDSGSTPTPPPTPNPHSASLSWSASISSGVTGYNIYRKTSSSGTYTKLNSSPIAGTTYTDNTVQAGQTYYYVATAVGTTGLESTYSNESIAVVPSP
jgi:fibronectin type 3 domain-containing protein